MDCWTHKRRTVIAVVAFIFLKLVSTFSPFKTFKSRKWKFCQILEVTRVHYSAFYYILPTLRSSTGWRSGVEQVAGETSRDWCAVCSRSWNGDCSSWRPWHQSYVGQTCCRDLLLLLGAIYILGSTGLDCRWCLKLWQLRKNSSTKLQRHWNTSKGMWRWNQEPAGSRIQRSSQ